MAKVSIQEIRAEKTRQASISQVNRNKVSINDIREARKSKSFGQQAKEVVGGTLAGVANIFGGGGQAGQVVQDVSAMGAIPATDKEQFRTTPFLETAGEMVGEQLGGPIGAGIGGGLGRGGDEGIRSLLGVATRNKHPGACN